MARWAHVSAGLLSPGTKSETKDGAAGVEERVLACSEECVLVSKEQRLRCLPACSSTV